MKELNLDDIKIKIDEINEFHNKLFIDSEEKVSIKTKIEDQNKIIDKLKTTQQQLIENLNSFSEETLYSTEEKKSTKEVLKELTTELNEKISDLNVKQQNIENFYNKLFIDNEDSLSIKNQTNNFHKNLKLNLENSDEKIREIEEFYYKVFDTENEIGEITSKGLKSETKDLKDRLENLITNSESKLHALTDSSLHNAFAIRAKNYSDQFSKLERYTFYCTLGLIFDIILFGFIQLSFDSFNYNLLIYQFSIAGALIFAIWMFNRNQKIAKKLAEEYHHKASISEAMTGYRALYGLNHNDDEYLTLFNSIKDQLNVNPSLKIDNFLNLKSPQEKISDSIVNTLDSETLKKLAEALKPELDNITP